MPISRQKIQRSWAYIFVAPQLLFVAAFTLYPIVMTHIFALFDWPGFGPLDDFVGLNNFISVLQDDLFWNAFRNSFVFMLGTVAIQLPVSLLLAILLNSPQLLGQTGRAVYRTLFFIPVITTSAIIGIVMRSIFASHNGLVNEALLLSNIISQPIRWLSRGETAMMALIIVASWKWMGIKMVMWLAGLQSIPTELYDAAKVDGATPRQTLFYVTIPLLIPVGIVILLFSVVDALTAFDLIFTMTEGGPGFTTEVMELYIYRFAFTSMGGGLPRLGFASAAGVVFGLTVFLISLILGSISRNVSKMRRA
jgi:ABC-type sugar transport system permease subunit